MESMITAHEQVGVNRYRESYGLHFEEFVVGDVFEHRPGRTVTELDNIWQSLVNTVSYTHLTLPTNREV